MVGVGARDTMRGGGWWLIGACVVMSACNRDRAAPDAGGCSTRAREWIRHRGIRQRRSISSLATRPQSTRRPRQLMEAGSLTSALPSTRIVARWEASAAYARRPARVVRSSRAASCAGAITSGTRAPARRATVSPTAAMAPTRRRSTRTRTSLSASRLTINSRRTAGAPSRTTSLRSAARAAFRNR